MYGEDKTSLEELKNTVNELQSLKIEILPKADKTNDLNNSIEKMENQIKQVDENLLNNTQFATTGNETAENTVEEEQQEIKTNENSNLNILISNIDTLTEKVNQAVKVETERKAEEERKAKEEQERKAREEEEKKQKQSYVGTYKNMDGNIITITMSENGQLTLKNNYGKNYELNLNKNSDVGKVLYNTYKTGDLAGFVLYPKGESIRGLTTDDTSKIRVMYYDLGISDSNLYYKQ